MTRRPGARRPMLAAACMFLGAVGCSLTTDLGGLSDGQSADGGGPVGTEGGSGPGPDGATPRLDGAIPDGGAGYVAALLADGPIAYYPLEEASGNTAADVIGGRNATFAGTFVRGVAGAVGKAALFDGQTTRLEMPPGAFTFAGRAPYSIEVWINPAEVDGQVRRIFHRGAQSGTDGGYELYFTDTYFQTARYAAGGGNDGYANMPALVVGHLVHAVMTYDGSLVMLYVNGVPSDTANGLIDQANQPDAQLVFGDRVGGTYFKFHGMLDEIAIYDKALSGARVAAHYNAR